MIIKGKLHFFNKVYQSAFNVFNQALYHIINAMSNQLIYIKLLRHLYNVSAIGMTSSIHLGQHMTIE
jgi:hypothetical protein